MSKLIKLREVLGAVDAFPWDHTLYMPHGVDWTLDTTCAVLDSNDENEADPENPKFAQDNALHYALGMQVIEGIVENAKAQKQNATLDDLLAAFIHYYDRDAYIDFSGVDG
jgi:hypothetical protein